MAMGAASIGLLMLFSLEALLLLVTGAAAAAGTSVIVASVSGGSIRLPSDDAARGLVVADAQRQAVAVTTTAADDEKRRPWECCDVALCEWSMKPFCVCMDLRCSDACKRCEQTQDSRHVCVDHYPGVDPGPTCHDHYYGNPRRGGLADAVQAAAAAVMADNGNAAGGGGDDETKGGGHERARRLARGHRF